MSDTPRIYVACLASYNNGQLHGRWIDCTDIDDVNAAINVMLKASPQPNAEEYAIHDHEGFGVYQVDEHHNITELCQIAQGIIEHGPAYAAWIDSANGYEPEDFEDHYRGEWSSVLEYATQLFDDMYEVPDELAPYIDYQAFARDLEIGDIWTHQDGSNVHIFDNY